MNWELEILEWIDKYLHGSNFINQIVRYFTILGEMGIVWFLIGGIFVAFKKTRGMGITLLIALVLIGGFNNFIFKPIIKRDRPFLADPSLLPFVEATMKPIIFGKGGVPDSYSFMSGHSLSGALCGFIPFLYDKKKYWGILVLGFLQGLSRLFLLVHYPTDILVGFAFGLLFGWGCYVLYRKIEKDWPKIRAKYFNRGHN